MVVAVIAVFVATVFAAVVVVAVVVVSLVALWSLFFVLGQVCWLLAVFAAGGADVVIVGVAFVLMLWPILAVLS